VVVWIPDNTIGEKELVGRRLHERPDSSRSLDDRGRPELELDDFYDGRFEEDLSIDRLGNPNPTNRTLAAITRIADAEATFRIPDNIFIGWFAINLKDFKFPGWTASVVSKPTQHEYPSLANHWHAEVNREGFRARAQAYALAFLLRNIFERRGRYQPAVR
jgi:hypothetical protein